jgi:Domain of unknown function (DUF4160)
MPKVFEVEGFRGFFFSNEGDPREPVHVHIRKGEGEAKFWVAPEVALAESWQMKVSELNRAEEIVIEHRQQILDFWNRYFNLNS